MYASPSLDTWVMTDCAMASCSRQQLSQQMDENEVIVNKGGSERASHGFARWPRNRATLSVCLPPRSVHGDDPTRQLYSL